MKDEGDNPTRQSLCEDLMLQSGLKHNTVVKNTDRGGTETWEWMDGCFTTYYKGALRKFLNLSEVQFPYT